MNYFYTSFRIALIQRLRNVKSWLILLLIPLLLIGTRMVLPQEQVSAPVQVGVVLPEEGGEAFWELLSDRSGTVLTFFQADEDTINRNITTGKWDCGLILAEDFDQKIQEADTERLFILRVGEGSSVYPLVQETVSSCVAALVRVPIAEKYLFSSGIVDTESDAENIRNQLEQFLDQDERVNITMSTPKGDPLHTFDLADRGVQNLLRWVVCATLMVWLLLCVCDLGRWSSSAAARRIAPLRSVSASMLARLCADSLVAIISGCLGMLAINDGLFGCIAVAAYVLFWSSIGILIAHFPAIWQCLPILPAFLVVTSLIFSGVLIDTASFLPAFAHVSQWVPGRLYLQLCEGSWQSLLPFLGTCVICLLLSAITEKIKKRCAA